MIPDQYAGLVLAAFVGAVVAAMVFGAWFGNLRNGGARATASMRQLARDLELEFVPADAFGMGMAVSGTIDEISVHIERAGAWLNVELSSKRIPDDVFVLRETSSTRDFGVPGAEVLGDPQLTNHILSPGVPELCASVARLDATTRNWLAREQASIRSRQIELSIPATDENARDRILAAIERAKALGAVQTPEGLLRNVENDPIDSVRRRSEELLLAHFAGTPEAAKRFALRVSSPAATPQERLAARILLPSERQLTFRAQDFELAHLVELLSGPQQEVILDVLISVGPRIEGLLLQLLPEVPKAVALRIVPMLGAHGTVASVETLLPYTKTLLGGDLDTAATDAIAQIQARLKGAGAGQLTVSEDPAAVGGLSVSTDEAGAVSIAPSHGKKQQLT